MRHGTEAFANAIAGLLVSIAAVHLLRAAGAWEAWPAWAISAVFFALSVARSWALRAWFGRGWDAR